MSQLPFDLSSSGGSVSGDSAGDREKQPWSVLQLSERVKGALASSLPGKLRVVGEISNLSDRNHWYFSLKDASASVRCVMFASSARRVGFAVKSGMQVVVTGRVDYYPAQGSVQLYVDKLEPVGQGARELALQAMIAELREAGYFALERKQRLPGIPRRVAVVTSRSAAALQDVINTASQRWGGCQLMLYDVRVQGDEAAPQVAAALRALSERGSALGIDAVILTRGGGSIEDLWAFNERVVADALYDCQLPVVAAIGHETDTTVAELVADLRCATPTQAAMTLIPDRVMLDEQVDQLARRMTLMLQRRLEMSGHRLDAVARHALFRQPGRLVGDAAAKLDQLGQRLDAAPARRGAEARRRLEALARTLEAVGPGNVLKRGYSYTLGGDGKLLRSVKQAKPGSGLTTVLADGRVESVVAGAAEGGEVVPTLPKPRRMKPRKSSGSDEPTLFA